MDKPIPAVVFSPGEHLRDELQARNWTQAEFAKMIGRPVELVNGVVNGRRGVSVRTAVEFSEVLGTSPEFWMNLDDAYHLWRYQTE